MPESDQLDKTRCSLLIFLATPAEEAGLIAAAQALNIPFERIKRSSLGKYFWFGQIGSEQVIAACPAREGGSVIMGSQGRLGTAARGITLRDATGSQGIVQLGMAFGVDPATQKLGDVLVSTSIIPYDNRIVSSFSPIQGGRAVSPLITSHRRRSLSKFPGTRRGYQVDYRGAKPQPARSSLVDLFRREANREHTFQVHVGSILSGAAIIHSRTFRDELLRGVPKGEDPIVGGEMEGVGLLAASSSSDDSIWCVVKGISDFADERRDATIGTSRPIACRNAADFLLTALQNERFG